MVPNRAKEESLWLYPAFDVEQSAGESDVPGDHFMWYACIVTD